MDIIERIKEHDVYFGFSDDVSVWRKGQTDFNEIVGWLKDHPEDRPQAFEAWDGMCGELMTGWLRSKVEG